MTEITPELLLQAYRQGIFPMAQTAGDPDIFWVNPEERGVIPLDKFHVPRKLAQSIRRKSFDVTFDQAFPEVIRACASSAHGRETTWISNRLIDLYERLHHMGVAHSIECWQAGKLAGGLYGVVVGSAFCGESMFHYQTDASKIALVHLIARLRYGGFSLLDTQFITPHLQQFGALQIPRDQYLAMLQSALAKQADFYLLDRDPAPEAILQLTTQTS